MAELFVSTDGGTVWNIFDSYYSDGGALVSDPNNETVFWSGGHNTFAMFAAKTVNSCSSWTRYYLAPVGCVYALAVDPTNSEVVYAGGNPGIFKTTNGGTNWINASSGLSGYVYALAVHPSNSNIVFAGTPDGVFRSTDGGLLWVNTGCEGVNSIVIDPFYPDTVYAGTIRGVYTSTTGGVNWQSMNTGLPDSNVTCIGISSDEFLYAGTHGTGMYRWSLNTSVKEHNPHRSQPTILSVYPNPSPECALITYSVTTDVTVQLAVYDACGRQIQQLVHTRHVPGVYRAEWNGCGKNNNKVSTGIYFVHLETPQGVSVSKLVYYNQQGPH